MALEGISWKNFGMAGVVSSSLNNSCSAGMAGGGRFQTSVVMAGRHEQACPLWAMGTLWACPCFFWRRVGVGVSKTRQAKQHRGGEAIGSGAAHRPYRRALKQGEEKRRILPEKRERGRFPTDTHLPACLKKKEKSRAGRG